MRFFRKPCTHGTSLTDLVCTALHCTALQLLRGKDGTPGTTWSLKAAQELLQESFDPIMDLSTNTDLLPLMIYARQYGEWDYKNVHVMLLRHKVGAAPFPLAYPSVSGCMPGCHGLVPSLLFACTFLYRSAR